MMAFTSLVSCDYLYSPISLVFTAIVCHDLNFLTDCRRTVDFQAFFQFYSYYDDGADVFQTLYMSD